MKVSTIVLCDAVMRQGGVQSAARATGVPVSTISNALHRLEKTLSVRLVIQAAGGLSPTAEGLRLRPLLHRAADEIRAIYALGPGDPARAAVDRPVSLIALFRFADILESGSIRKTARRLQVGQPQLTRMIAQLEDSVGTGLLQRGRGGSRATAAGLAIAPRVDCLRDLWTQLDSTSELRFRRHLRHWSLGGIPPATADSPSARILGRIAANWAGRFDTPLYLQAGLADVLLEGLEQQHYDAVLVDMPVVNPRLRSHEVQRSPLSFFTRGPDPHAPEAPIAEAVLARKLVLPSRGAGLRQIAEGVLGHLLGPDWLSRVQLTEIDSIPVAVDLVANHGYCSILPQAIGEQLPELTTQPLPAAFAVSLQLAWRDDDRGAAMARRLFDVLDLGAGGQGGPTGVGPRPRIGYDRRAQSVKEAGP